MTEKLVYGDVSFSTADVEQSQFAGETKPLTIITFIDDPSTPIPPGEYRVIDGELFLVVDGRGPDHEPQPHPSSSH